MSRNNSKAGGCLFFLLLAIGSAGLVTAITSFRTETSESPPPIPPVFPYEHVASSVRDSEMMQLFAFGGEIVPNQLAEFCRTRKNATGNAVYVVLFDSRENAAFPNSPFSAAFGIEEEKMKHIRAMYIYRKANGVSELSIYDPNMWQGKPSTSKGI